MKAKLSARQVGAAVAAGIVGHLLFSVGWGLLWLALAGGLLSGILGLTLESLAEQFAQGSAAGAIFDNAGGLIGGLVVGAVVAGLVLVLLSFLISGWILSASTVRKPWGTSFWSLLISAALSLPLLLLYVGISGRGEGGLPFPLVALLGAMIVGVLVWLWMTWAHRGVAAGVSAAVVTPPGSAEERSDSASPPSS